MTAPSWAWVRPLAGGLVLGGVLWRTGTGPFLDGLRSVDALLLAAGAVIAVPTTVAAAWRWRLVARRLGVDIALGAAVASSYRSQFLNCTLPGGIVGDVHRGVRHGRDTGELGRALRSVVWERLGGHVVQVAITLAVLLVLPSPVRSWLPLALLALLAALAAGAVVTVIRPSRPGGGTSLLTRLLRVARRDIRRALLARGAWPGVAGSSAVALVGHVTTFFVAARAAGVSTGPSRLLPLALIVLLAMAVPLNVAGWGPREGVAAWSFSAAGLGFSQGVATTVVYGVMVTVATLPGAVVLVASGRAARRGAQGSAVTAAQPATRMAAEVESGG